MNTQNLSYENLNSDQLYEFFYKHISEEFEKNGMRTPFIYKSNNHEINFLFKNEFLINSELDLEITAIQLSIFPYGSKNKYCLGDFFRNCDLINRARNRYMESEGYKSFKDFYENCEEAFFDKVVTHLPRKIERIKFNPMMINQKIIQDSEDLINMYGLPSPMNYLESELNEAIIDLYLIYQDKDLTLEEFEESVYDKRLFLRSYLNGILRNIEISNLITLDEFFENEISCSYY